MYVPYRKLRVKHYFHHLASEGFCEPRRACALPSRSAPRAAPENTPGVIRDGLEGSQCFAEKAGLTNS